MHSILLALNILQILVVGVVSTKSSENNEPRIHSLVTSVCVRKTRARQRVHRDVSVRDRSRRGTAPIERLHRLTPILISRFLLNLRDAAHSPGDSTDAVYDSRVSIPGFRVPTTGMGTLADNMGAMLGHDHDSLSIEFDGGTEENLDDMVSLRARKVRKPPGSDYCNDPNMPDCSHIIEEASHHTQGLVIPSSAKYFLGTERRLSCVKPPTSLNTKKPENDVVTEHSGRLSREVERPDRLSSWVIIESE